MLKGYLTDIAKEIGRSPALVLNQILQWYRGGLSVNAQLYRTDQEMVDDLDNVISLSTFKRAKRVLEAFGYIKVSYGKGYNRTTHYALTSLSIELLIETTKPKETIVGKNDTSEELIQIKDNKNPPEQLSSDGENKSLNVFLPKDEYVKKLKAEGRYKPKQPVTEMIVPKSMVDSFVEQGKERSDIVKPQLSLSEMLKLHKQDKLFL